MADGSHPVEDVRSYYENNTSVWERFGQGRIAIHRAVWADGVASRAEAFGHLDRLIAEEAKVAAGDSPRCLDLGCGLGASLMNLAALLPKSTGIGVTISPKQAARAQQLIAMAGLSDRISCVESDYLSLPRDIGTFDIAFAIESFVHSADAEAFFASVAPRLRRGGRLIICDDFLARSPRDEREQRWLEQIRRGWVMSSLITVKEATELAHKYGLALVQNRDLTASLELRRPRDRLLAALLFVARPFRPQGMLWRSWLGGDALQRALVARLVEFHFLVLQRSQA
jgi:cyclopropane fatty-acyl-phospholipid synthase-like methyltransferase